jgi:preprotein translocase subunit SecG
MYLFLIILIVIVALFMCFIVVIQNSKGGGLASGFSSSNQIMGVRKTTDILEKATWISAAIIVGLSILTAYVLPYSTGKDGSVIMEQAQQENQTNPMNLPDFATPAETAAPEASADSTGN